MSNLLWSLALLAQVIGNPFLFTPSSSLVSFSDDFNRSDSTSLGSNWTEIVGDQKIASNTLRNVTTGYGKTGSVYSGAATLTSNQYAKVQLINSGYEYYIETIFRYTNSSSPYYGLGYSWIDDLFYWNAWDNAADPSETDCGNTSATINTGDFVGITITGTGSSTTVRLWVNPTGDAPTSATVWGGAGPVATLTNPTVQIDGGTYIGLEGVASGSDQLIVDNFYGGDIP